ncbi:hypothetical protein PGT21_035959 [Puccinia graminis f. sp. tritici]|uniref:Uncharacterized protein n=1 Tax=Puccinia graminis f. sp. tritici TaxID=56615 RepID=A0A5B0Q0D1_PUCGR|nr:hypothetical protein PGT21_035959 [Puccinia graminis f. sp. tritici]KAA1126268.1 hypothetical protein PGTUg99_022542 [Puccinia graminis f. sp. tritici]
MDSLLKTLGLRGSELKPLQLIKKFSSVGCKLTSGSNATSTTAGTVTQRKGKKSQEIKEPLDFHLDYEKSQTAKKGQPIGTPASSSETLPHEEDIRSDKLSSEDELAMIPLTDDTESPIITVRSLLVGFLVYLVQRKETLPLDCTPLAGRGSSRRTHAWVLWDGPGPKRI